MTYVEDQSWLVGGKHTPVGEVGNWSIYERRGDDGSLTEYYAGLQGEPAKLALGSDGLHELASNPEGWKRKLNLAESFADPDLVDDYLFGDRYDNLVELWKRQVTNPFNWLVAGHVFAVSLPRPVFGTYLAKKAPYQIAPGVRTLKGVYVNDLGRVEPWVAHYDEYGRLFARTDFNAGNKAAGIDDIHHHLYEWGPGKTPKPIGDHIPGPYQP